MSDERPDGDAPDPTEFLRALLAVSKEDAAEVREAASEKAAED